MVAMAVTSLLCMAFMTKVELSSNRKDRLEQSIKLIQKNCSKSGIPFQGPVRIKRNLKRFTLLKSPFKFAFAQEQYELCTYTVYFLFPGKLALDRNFVDIKITIQRYEKK